MCGYGMDAKGTGEKDESQDGEEEIDVREWKPEMCFSAIDVQFGGKVVDLSKNITMGQLEKAPGKERLWRVPHYVKVRTAISHEFWCQ